MLDLALHVRLKVLHGLVEYTQLLVLVQNLIECMVDLALEPRRLGLLVRDAPRYDLLEPLLLLSEFLGVVLDTTSPHHVLLLEPNVNLEKLVPQPVDLLP